MDRTLKMGLLALVAVLALVAIAVSVSADPANTNNAPTEDWIFDEGKVTTIKSKVWTLSYNITVTNGSVLKLDGCTFTVDGVSSWDPVFIYGDLNSTIELTSSKFLSSEDTSGFYVEAHDNLTITDCEFEGLVENPAGNAGITVIGNEFMTVKVDFVEVRDTRMAAAMYFENVQVEMSNCEIHDIEGTAVTFAGVRNTFYANYNLSIIDTEIYNVEGQGLGVRGTRHAGIFNVDLYTVDIWNITEDGIFMLLGSTVGDGGNGTMFATYDHVNVWDVGDMAVYMSSLYQVAGDGNLSNVFNVTFTNSTFSDSVNTGMYVQMVSSVVEFSLVLKHIVFTNISLNPTFQRVGAIWWWYQPGSGGTSLWAEDVYFGRINPYCFEVWDYGSSDFYFKDCEFTRFVQGAVYQTVRSNANGSPTSFEDCIFHDADAEGISVYMEYRGSGVPVQVTRCEIWNLTYAALVGDSSSYGKNYGFNVTDSWIHDIDSEAVDLYAYYVEGTLTLHLENTTVERTGGVRMELSQDSYQSGTTLDFMAINCSITDTKGSAISIYGSSYYNPCRANAIIINSTIDEATGDGISIKTEVSGTSSYYKPRWDANVKIINVDITNVDAIAISMVSSGGSSMPGTREFEINYTTVHDAQRGLFDVGYSGALWYCDIQGTLKEDIFAIDSRLDLWYCNFQDINDRKFKALEGGEIHFYYDMNIYVRWDTGAAAIGANVQVFDNKQTLISVLNVREADGSLPTFTMEPFFVRETGIFSSSPYVVNVTFLQVQKTVGVRLDKSRDVFIVLEDHFEPEVFILYPKEGHIQQSTTLQVRGSAWDSQSGIKHVLLSLDGANWETATGDLRWNYTFEVSDELIGKFSGLFLLRAKAVDNADNERVAFVQIRIDPTPPELKVDFPYNGYVTNNPELWVRGVTELGSTVEINSLPVPVTVSMFTHMVTLVEGPNTISIISIDPLGNIQIERMTVYLDTQEPYIILISPEEDRAMTNQDSITIEATVEEDLTITVNGYLVPYGSEHYPEDEGILTYEVSLEPGENVVVIQARDKADNLRVIDFVVTYDTTPPWIQVISPRDGSVLPRPEITVIGTIDPTATLKIQGESVTVTNGFFEIVILAFEGDNTLHFTAEDAAGNVYEEDLMFDVDTQDPMLTITSPDEDEVTTNEVRYTISGTTGFDLGGSWVVSAGHILVNGKPYTEVYDEEAGEKLPVLIQVDSEGNFEIPVDLLEGRNEFTIEALDEVGNKASSTVTVRLDTVAPTLVMYIDPVFIDKEELVSNAYTVNITGYTDPGSLLTINDIPLPVSEDGEFNTAYDLAPGYTDIVLKSVDGAENERIVSQSIKFKKVSGGGVDEGPDTGLIILIVAIVLLAVVIVGMFVFVRGRREDMMEMEAAEATPLAPVEETVLEEPDTLPGPEELEMEVEAAPAPTRAPARPRPRPPQRRVAGPRPVPKGEIPELGDKDLSEKDAEADVEADETDQEGI